MIANMQNSFRNLSNICSENQTFHVLAKFPFGFLILAKKCLPISRFRLSLRKTRNKKMSNNF